MYYTQGSYKDLTVKFKGFQDVQTHDFQGLWCMPQKPMFLRNDNLIAVNFDLHIYNVWLTSHYVQNQSL